MALKDLTVGALFSQLLSLLGIDQLFDFLLKKFPALQRLLDLGSKIIEHFTGTFKAAVNLFNSAHDEFEKWKSFKEDVHFRQRVIVIESALTKAKKLLSEIVSAWKEILQLIRNAGLKLETGGAAEIVEAASGIGLPVAIVNGIVLIVEILDTIRNLIDTGQNIIDVVTGLREFLQGEFIFLSQSNKRKTLKLEDGSTIRVRLGKLHANNLA